MFSFSNYYSRYLVGGGEFVFIDTGLPSKTDSYTQGRCDAHVTERVRPGTVHSYEAGAKYDPLEPGKPGSIDRGESG